MKQVQSGEPNRLAYMPQLDSLRAFAIVGVMEHHFIHNEELHSLLPVGWLGVRLFFVLSGFLITGILLKCRQKIESGQFSTQTIVKHFYIRRLLRLSPVYYLYLILVVVMLPQSREHIWAFVFYGQNFLFAYKPEVYSYLMAHFWTLAVEEQFYLTWIWLIIFLPERHLVLATASVVVLGLVTRIIGLSLGLTPFQIEMMMPAHLDTLAMGGLLAALRSPTIGNFTLAQGLLRTGVWIGSPLLLVYFLGKPLGLSDATLAVLGESAAGLFCVWVIGRASIGYKGLIGKILEQKALIYLGRISYGIYVLHFNVPGLLREKLLPKLGLMAVVNSEVALFLLSIFFSVAIAAISWHLIEKPINRLKRYFPY